MAEHGVRAFIGSKDLGARLGLHGIGMNIIAVIVIDDKKLVVAGAGREDESAGLSGKYLAGGFHAGRKAVVCAATICRGKREVVEGKAGIGMVGRVNGWLGVGVGTWLRRPECWEWCR